MRLLAMSGFVPEHICDIVRFTGYTGERNIAHYCGYANDFISQVINDYTIDGAVFPKSCDSSRVINSYIDEANKFSFQITVPARNDELAVNFFSKEIEKYKNAIEKYFKIEIANIEERIQRINERNRIIEKYYSSLENYSYTDYLSKIHSLLNRPLMEENIGISLNERINTGKRVFLVGSFLCNNVIAEKIEKNGFCVVGDNLPESGRIAGSIVNDKEDDKYKAIARDILSRRLSPTQNNFKSLLTSDLNIIKDKKVDAVIFITQQYCEPYDYLYSVYKKVLDERRIPSLKISLNDSQDDRKVDLLLEAFSGTL